MAIRHWFVRSAVPILSPIRCWTCGACRYDVCVVVGGFYWVCRVVPRHVFGQQDGLFRGVYKWDGLPSRLLFWV